MNILLLTQILAGAGAIFCISAFTFRLRKFLDLASPIDRSIPRGRINAGVAYALTLGMMPWAKESTRRHALAYLRGVGFHLVVFMCLAIFLGSPWLRLLPTSLRSGLAYVTVFGALLAFLGFLARFFDKTLKALSTPDDYFAILLVSLFLSAAALALWVPTTLPWFYLLAALIFVYMPLGKIRHCIYFAFSRLFFGRFFGRRGIFPHEQQEVRA